jgi:hypothetical protein
LVRSSACDLATGDDRDGREGGGVEGGDALGVVDLEEGGGRVAVLVEVGDDGVDATLLEGQVDRTDDGVVDGVGGRDGDRRRCRQARQSVRRR